MKTIKDIIELYKPKSADEDRFVKKHVIKKTEDANGNKDDVFNATNVNSVDRTPKHGYNPGEDEKVYEGYEEIRFDDPENNSKPSRSSKPMRNRSKRIDDMMNKLGNEHGQKNLASEIKQRYSTKNEEAQEQSSTDKKADRLAIIAAAAKKKKAQIGKTIVTGSKGGVGGAETRRYPAGTLKNSYEPEGEELDEAKRKLSPIEKLYNRPSMQFAKKYTDQKKVQRHLGIPYPRHLPKEGSDTGTTSSLEGEAKQKAIEKIASRTMQNNSYELEGQQLNEFDETEGRGLGHNKNNYDKLKRDSIIRGANAKPQLKPGDIPVGQDAPVRPTVASSVSPVRTFPAPAPTAGVAKSLPPVNVASSRSVVAPKPVSTYKGTTASQNLAKLNKIKDVNKISVGQNINLGGKSYTVQKGDTLDKISKRNTAPSASSKASKVYNDVEARVQSGRNATAGTDAPPIRSATAIPSGSASSKASKVYNDVEARVQSGRNATAGTDAPPIRSATAIPSGENPRGGFGPGRGNHPVDLGKVASSVKSFFMRPATSGRGAYGKQIAVNSSYEPEGDQFNELVLNPFLRGLLEATCKECGEKYKGKTCPCCMKEDVQLDEILEPSMGAAAYIKDFVDSKNPKFDGLSKEKRKQMALAAYYAAKKGK